MLRRLLLLLTFVISVGLTAQDFLSVPASNPKLFYLEQQQLKKEKINVQEGTLIYTYDTLELPFIDDFSTDHFPKRIESPDGISIGDTTVYSIFINDIVYRDTIGFVRDPTFLYFIKAPDTIVGIVQFDDTLIQPIAIDRFPTSSFVPIRVFPAYNIYDTLGGGRDTVWINEPEFVSDSATYTFLPGNSNDYYTDRSVYRNTTFGLKPPSIGVATFDGLDQFGMPYDLVNALRVKADSLTSVPINLSNLPNNNVFFSFYYQPKGLSLDAPEKEDSLVLEFFNVTTRRWGSVWDTIGFESDTFLQKIIRVPDAFQQNGFQFRFRNYANSAGAFDQWHIDYLYLNHSRSYNDTIYNDIAYVYDAPTLLKEYTAMPWFHFRDDPARYMEDTVFAPMVNASAESKSVFNKVVISDTIPDTIYYQFPADNTTFIPIPSGSCIDLKHPLRNFSYPVSAIDSAGIFEATYDIDFRPSPSEDEDFIRSNDTIIGKTVLLDYYAYDDGSAEAGYGVNPAAGSAYMAVEFEIPFEDTIRGIDLYFLPQEFDVRIQSFELTVWNTLSPNGVIFSKTVKDKAVYSDENAFVTYLFDTLLKVNQTFYVGIRGIGPRSFNIGYDLNTNSKNRIFWSQNGSAWNNPSNGIADGSLMLRPLLRGKKFEVGIEEQQAQTQIQFHSNQIQLYPNPTNQLLNVVVKNAQEISQMMVLDLSGRVVLDQQFESKIDVAQLKDGLYFLRLLRKDGQMVSKKFLVAH